jgi:hypothetical protein
MENGLGSWGQVLEAWWVRLKRHHPWWVLIAVLPIMELALNSRIVGANVFEPRSSVIRVVLHFFPMYLFLVLEMEPRSLHVLNRCFTTELHAHPSPRFVLWTV